LIRRFYEDVIVVLPFMEWQLDEDQIKLYLERIYNEEKENETV